MTGTKSVLTVPESALNNSYIRAYWDDIQAGRAVVGYYVKQQMKLLLADLENPQLKIDFDESEKRIRFIERECRHSEAPFAGKPFTLMPWQKAIIEAIFAIKTYNEELQRYVRKYQEVLLVVARKNGKALDLNTKIPTPQGWRTMGELEIGDEVFAVDGTPSKIIAVSPVRYNHSCYRVTFEDGAKVVADAEHLWTVTNRDKRTQINHVAHRKNDFVVTTEEMASRFMRKRNDGKGVEYLYRVPMNAPVEYSRKELPISPYMLGVWLGDGESARAYICCGKADFVEMSALIMAEGYNISSVRNDKTGLKLYVSMLVPELRKLNLIKKKHIPPMYLQSSVSQRWELLRGLMDTDGSCSKAGQCEFVQKKKAVVDGIVELLSSLGIKNTVKTKISTIDGKECDMVYRVQFFTDGQSPCFKLKRKIARLKPFLNKRMKYKSIVDITPVESVPVKCIGIDHTSQLYLAGERFTATHNTPLASAISLAEWCCGEMGTKILYGSNDYDQADLLFMATDAMREASPKLARCTRRNQRGIWFGNAKQKTRAGKFSRQNKGSIRKMSAHTSAKEGRNIKIGVVDEVHELKDDTFVMPIKQALSTQDEPLYLEITTEGFTEDGYLDSRLRTAAAVLSGEVDKPNWLIWWYAQDSEEEIWQNENSWYKSNPGLGTIKKWSFLRGMVEDAKLSAATRAFVLAKDFNVRQNSAAAWLPEHVLASDATFDLEELRGQYYIGGIDLSETTDLTAAVALFVNPWTRQKFALSKYFIPAVKLDERFDSGGSLNPERKDYREWARQGLVEICEGNEVDPAAVVAWYFSLAENYNLRPLKFGFDVWHSTALKKGIAEFFGEDTLVRVGMNFFVLSNPMSLLETDLMTRKLNYGNNEVTRWCLRNVALKLNNLGLKMPVKVGGSKNRIDGAVALIIAYAAAATCKPEYDMIQKEICPRTEDGEKIAL